MDDLTFFLALWGAFLSTYLAIREARKDRRQVKILLELGHWENLYRLVITNTGHRPITIDQVSVSPADKRYGQEERIPPGVLTTDSKQLVSDVLPHTLEDGKMMIFHFSRAVTEELKDKNKFLKIEVFDAEGNIYNKYTKGEYDSKYNYRSGVTKSPGFVKAIGIRIKHWWINRRQRL